MSAIGDDKRAWLYARAVTCRGRLSCAYCGSWVVRVSLSTRLAPEHVATVDHVVPLARGGTHSPDNLVVCCCSCNARKGDRPARWRRTVATELAALPSPQALAAWRAKILARDTGAARKVRMLASAAWSTPDAPGLHASRVQCSGAPHRWPVVGRSGSGRAKGAARGTSRRDGLGVNASGAR